MSNLDLTFLINEEAIFDLLSKMIARDLRDSVDNCETMIRMPYMDHGSRGHDPLDVVFRYDPNNIDDFFECKGNVRDEAREYFLDAPCVFKNKMIAFVDALRSLANEIEQAIPQESECSPEDITG